MRPHFRVAPFPAGAIDLTGRRPRPYLLHPLCASGTAASQPAASMPPARGPRAFRRHSSLQLPLAATGTTQLAHPQWLRVHVARGGRAEWFEPHVHVSRPTLHQPLSISLAQAVVPCTAISKSNLLARSCCDCAWARSACHRQNTGLQDLAARRLWRARVSSTSAPLLLFAPSGQNICRLYLPLSLHLPSAGGAGSILAQCAHAAGRSQAWWLLFGAGMRCSGWRGACSRCVGCLEKRQLFLSRPGCSQGRAC